MAARKHNKSAFVRGLPPDTPAAEVVKRAAAAGMKLSPAYVYVIRSKGAAKRRGRTPAAKARLSGGGIEKQFVNLALDMGFARAQELLDSARAKARQAIG